MNNKGQTLVLFVIILPIMLLFIYFVYTKVLLYGEKNHQQNIANSICRHYKKGASLSELEILIIGNDEKQKYEIKEKNNTILIILEKDINNLLNKKDKVKTEILCE